MNKTSYFCVVCGGSLSEVPAYARLPRVTSDSRPFRAGGRLASCDVCNAVQKIPDERWFAEIDEIYSTYDIYHQSGDVDQPVFDPGTGHSRPRSAVLAEFLAAAGMLAPRGRALDVGCGGGAFLAGLAAKRREWHLFGNDLSDRNETALLAIPGFVALYTGELAKVPGQYDLISLIHSLEHLPTPVESLRALKGKLAPEGRLFIQVPDIARTPFDLVVADHLSHFSVASLFALVTRAGLAVERIETNVVVKEITLVARLPDCAVMEAPQPAMMPSRLPQKIAWLSNLVDIARKSAERGPVGVFGTSIAAVWLFAGLEGQVGFFVDEDASRVGRKLFGRPVLAPENMPSGSTVILALIPDVAAAVAKRIRRPSIHLITPVAPAIPSTTY